MFPYLKGDAMDVIALADEQCSGDGAINAPLIPKRTDFRFIESALYRGSRERASLHYGCGVYQNFSNGGATVSVARPVIKHEGYFVLAVQSVGQDSP